MTTGSATASRYRVVDWRELVFAGTSGLVITLLFLPLTMAIMGTALLRPHSTAGTVGFAMLAMLAVATQMSLVFYAVRSWWPDPLLRVGPDGIELRVERYGDNGRGRRVRLSWAEVGSVGLAPPANHDDPGPVAAPAVEGYLAYQAGHGFGRPAERRWDPGPGRTLVIVGLAPHSPAQAGEFDRHLSLLRDFTEGHVGVAGPGGRPLVILAAQLADWQREWSGVAQPLGMHGAVRDRNLDPARLDAALRAYGRSLQQLEPPRVADLDTPHGIALLLVDLAGHGVT